VEDIKQKLKPYWIDLVNFSFDIKRMAVNLFLRSMYCYLLIIFTNALFTFLFTQSGYPIEKWENIPNTLAWGFSIIYILLRFPFFKKGRISIDYDEGWKEGYKEGCKITEHNLKNKEVE